MLFIEEFFSKTISAQSINGVDLFKRIKTSRNPEPIFMDIGKLLAKTVMCRDSHYVEGIHDVGNMGMSIGMNMLI